MTTAVAERQDPMAVFDDPVFRDQLSQVVRSTHAASRGFAADAFLLSAMARAVPAPVGTGEGAIAWQSFVREIACARKIGDTAAATEINRAVLLARHLPRALELLACGKLAVGRAQAFCDELLHVSAPVALAVDKALAHRLNDLAPAGIRQATRRAIDRHDADAAADRAAKATARRGIRTTAERDGQAQAIVTGPALPLTRWYTALTDAARAQQATGDLRGLDALRFDLLMAGFTAPDDPSPDSPTEPATVTEPATPAAERPTVDVPPGQSHPASGSREATTAAEPDSTDPAATAPEVLRAARAEATRLITDARAEAARVLATARAQQQAAQADTDRLTAQNLATRLALSQQNPTDRRQVRPVQVLVHVPITTALGLSNEPGWVDGYGWLNAPQCRQLLPTAELRQVCLSPTGQVVDLAPHTVRPDPTPTGAREALLKMATEPFDITDTAWQTQAPHDPSTRLKDLVQLRDRFCDGPTGLLWPAQRADLDHDHAHPDGPTAAWNLVARARRTHRLKHRGWAPFRTATDTIWFSPAGQVLRVPRFQQPPPELDDHPPLPDPQALHDLETELLRPPTDDDDPPQPPPF